MESKNKVDDMSVSADPDEDILELLSGTDSLDRAFRQIFSRYRERLYWVIRRMAGTHEDTDDILQEVFIKVHRHLETFRRQSKLYSWIYRIAVNETLTHIAKKKKKNDMLTEASKGIVERPEVEYDYEEIMKLLQKAVLTLPEKQKMVFLMRYFEDMSYKEISAELDLTVGSLKASYHHAVKKVEDYVRQYGT